MESQSVWLKDLIELAVHVYNPQLPFSPDTVARYSRNISSESHSHPISFSRAVENIQRSTNNISLLAYTFTQAKARIGQATEWIFGRHGRIASHHEEIKTYIRDINALQSDIYDKDSTRQKLHSALRQLLEHFLNIYTDPNISPEGRASTNALLFSAAQHLSRIPAEALEKEPELIFFARVYANVVAVGCVAGTRSQ
ncbi:hypothetical protein LRY60_03715 [Candidatus Woesebacteria bacterium]|nr:hypothetical protein [Candidatus Woesebacteria bacterium]